MVDPDVRRNWIAAAQEERTRLHAVLTDARRGGQPIAIAAAKAAADAAQDTHMDAMQLMFSEQFNLARRAIPYHQARPTIPWLYRRRLGTLRRKFDEQFKLRVAQLGISVGMGDAVHAHWLDHGPNPWRTIMVREILHELLQNFQEKMATEKQFSVEMRKNLLVKFMTARQIQSHIDGDRFHADNSLKGFLEKLGKFLFRRSPHAEFSHLDILRKDWSQWQNYTKLDHYKGGVDASRHVGAPRKPNLDIALAPPPGEMHDVRLPWASSKDDLWERWLSQLNAEALTEVAEKRAIRIMTSMVGEAPRRPAFEGWRWATMAKSTSGGWNVDPLMVGSLIAVEGTHKRGAYEVPVIVTEPFTLELPAGTVGLIFAPSEQWKVLKDANLISPIADRVLMRAIDQISLNVNLENPALQKV